MAELLEMPRQGAAGRCAPGHLLLSLWRSVRVNTWGLNRRQCAPDHGSPCVHRKRHAWMTSGVFSGIGAVLRKRGGKRSSGGSGGSGAQLGQLGAAAAGALERYTLSPCSLLCVSVCHKYFLPVATHTKYLSVFVT